jgi:GNAT superfamily N-acetyltransferase
MITYRKSLEGITPEMLTGFFVGWPNPPTPSVHLRLLRDSAYRILAFDEDACRVVGFITAISDGVLTAFIPLLEVLPEYQGRGIGRSLVKQILAELSHLYSVDLVCDENLRPYYERFGLIPVRGMARRNYAAQSGTINED